MYEASILIAIPFFLLAILIEISALRRQNKQAYRFNDAITNLNIGIGQQAMGLFFKSIMLYGYVKIYEYAAILHIPQTWWAFLLCLVAFDFAFYWAHRLGHESNLFWGAHSVHHQSEEYNLSVALRQSWFHSFISFFIFLPLAVVGFHPVTFTAAAGINIIYQFWIHTQAIGKLPRWIEAIWNTPSHHRVHHAVNQQYIDRNHAGMFIVWDKLFGTFEAENEAPIYGITTPLRSWNPFWANVHYYIELWQLGRQFKRLRDRLHLWIAPPGWLPNEQGGYQAPPHIAPDRPKYQTETPLVLNLYVFAQFLLITLGLVAFMYYFPTISVFYKVVFLGIIILSMQICGAIFESRTWVKIAEFVRLILVFISLNTFYYYWYSHWLGIMLISSVIAYIGFNIWFGLALHHSKKMAL
jgi:alkylglycerol monooxygenase